MRRREGKYKPSDRLREEPVSTSAKIGFPKSPSISSDFLGKRSNRPQGEAFSAQFAEKRATRASCDDVPKLEKRRNPKFKADKVEAKLSDRLQYTEKKLGKANLKLSNQKPQKRRGVGNVVMSALGNEISAKIHGKIHEVERDNVGVEAAHKAELMGERAARSATRYIKNRARTRPTRRVAKWERKHVKASVNSRFNTLAKQNPALRKNIFKRQLQKRRLKKLYQKQSKWAAIKTLKLTWAVAAKAVVLGVKAVKLVVLLAVKKAKILLIAGVLLLLAAVIYSCVSSALTIGGGLGGAISETTYIADDNEINNVTLLYIQWETDLLITTRNAAIIRPGYDEYHYIIIGNVWHNPFELITYLTIRYDDFTVAEVEPTMRDIFAAQYTLTHVSTTETRDGESVRVLTTTLTARNFSEVIAERLTTEDEQERFYMYMLFHGNRQIVGSPFDFNWFPHVTSFFGYRVHPIHGDRRFHEGLDISAPTGTPILAGGAGVVVSAGWNGGFGLTVIVDYGDGITALYAHCSELLVSAGQSVNIGDIIALVGSTGDSTGPHLHIEIRVDGVLMNPLFFVDGTRDE